MTIHDKIGDELLQDDINREAAKISALSPGKIDKYECLTGEEILTPDQSRVREQAKMAYSPLGKTSQKRTKMIDSQGKKQTDSITDQNKKLQALTNKDDYKSIYLVRKAQYKLNALRRIIKFLTIEKDKILGMLL